MVSPVRTLALISIAMGCGPLGCASDTASSPVRSAGDRPSQSELDAGEDAGEGEPGRDAASEASPRSPEAAAGPAGEGPVMCRAEAGFSGCDPGAGPPQWEALRARASGRGSDRAAAAAAALGACQDRLAQVWRFGPWPRLRLDRPCQVVECGPTEYGGHAPRASVRLAKLRRGSGRGASNTDEAQRVLAGVVGLINDCYQELLDRAPRTAGTVSVELRLDAGGEVIAVRASVPGSPDSPLLACVTPFLEPLRFPEGAAVLETEIFMRPLVLGSGE